MRKLLLLLLIIGMSIFLANAVYALTATDTMQISATSVAACTVTAQDINFGEVSGQIANANGLIQVTCTQGVAYTVALDAGQNSSGPYTARRMSDGSGNYLEYGLTNDAGYSWGDTGFGDTFPSGAVVQSSGTGSVDDYNVYGSTYGELVPEGTYTDVVNVTVYY